MTNIILSNSLRFVFLIFLQVLILNNINFLGYINPYLYILFIILYPFTGNQGLLLLLAFLLGWSIDIFEDSGGINAAASLVIAYIRPYLLRFSFGLSYDYQSVKLSNSSFGAMFSYVSLMVLVHHLVLFSLEIFSFAHLLLLFKEILFSAVFSIVLILLSLSLFMKQTR